MVKQTWNYGLGGDTVSSVVQYHSAQSEETLQVLCVVHHDTLQVVARGHEGGRISAKLFVMILHVETKAEEDVVPDEHLHLGFFPRIYCHHISLKK